MKVVAFDVFGTVFDMSSVNRQELKYYAEHISKPLWEPLKFSKSWETIPAHSDSKAGISKLRENFIVVTCSNGPLGLLTKLSKYNGISWDAIIPLELNKVFKPNLAAYMTVCEVLNIEPRDMIMVTANKDFGDIEAAIELGMEPQLIRHPNHPQNILELATYLKARHG